MRPAIVDDVRKALALPAFDPRLVEAAHGRMSPQPPRPARPADGNVRLAAVLVLLYSVDEVLTFPLMQRTEYEGVHSGQISLPGGSREGDETFEQTALRETREEFGVMEPVEILGALTPLYVPPSNFEIHPIVGTLPSRPIWDPDPAEVATIIEAPLATLFDERVKGLDEWRLESGIVRLIPFYQIGTHKVWGATAAMLSELEARLRVVIPQEQFE